MLPAAFDGVKVEVQARTGECLAGLERRNVVSKACRELPDPVSQPLRRSLPRSMGATRHIPWDTRRVFVVRGLTAVGGGVDDLACTASIADDQVVVGQLSTDRVDVNAVHARCLGNLIIVERHGALADDHEDLVSPLVGARHRSIMPIVTREVHDEVADASSGGGLRTEADDEAEQQEAQVAQ